MWSFDHSLATAAKASGSRPTGKSSTSSVNRWLLHHANCSKIDPDAADLNRGSGGGLVVDEEPDRFRIKGERGAVELEERGVGSQFILEGLQGGHCFVGSHARQVDFADVHVSENLIGMQSPVEAEPSKGEHNQSRDCSERVKRQAKVT